MCVIFVFLSDFKVKGDALKDGKTGCLTQVKVKLQQYLGLKLDNLLFGVPWLEKSTELRQSWRIDLLELARYVDEDDWHNGDLLLA